MYRSLLLVHTFLRNPLPSLCLRCRYGTMITASIMLYVGLNAKPDTRIGTWARKVAMKELKEEGKL